jgi:Asp-tRNA(Asn)/Glu-tRNA(Gln) amidotransferase A subunit family amidase
VFSSLESQGLSIVEASIENLQAALKNGQINAVQLTAKHLHRVAQYDRRGPRLNAIPVINPLVFEHAQASDTYRALNGTIRSDLEGLPGTLKDSYMMEGMTVASGSPAFVNLTATADAFTTSQLRSHGAIILGKTNMPPMANGGMQRGVYGRAESPYNKTYLAAAYASGSSNGAGASTASSMGVFAMAEETVSSGRSPASNNGLIAYTPSRGVLSIRGNWPLFPVADVVVPYARTVKDLLSVLDVIVEIDRDTTSDFWRGQPFVSLPSPSEVRPGDSYQSLALPDSLSGKRIGVPKMYIGGNDPKANPIWVSPGVQRLWKEARITLEALGATVEEVDFPLVTEAEAPGQAAWETEYPLPGFKRSSTPGPSELASYSWDDFLHMVNDTSVSGITSLAQVDGATIFPQLPGTLRDRYGNSFGNRTASNTNSVEIVKRRNRTNIYDLPSLEAHLRGVEEHRKIHLEAWMDDLGLDAVVFPAAGDVGREDAETNDNSAVHAWRNGVFFSNGNYAIRQYGVPTVTTTMGLLPDIGMPMGLTFASKAYDDNALLSYAYAFETAHVKGSAPLLTPVLPTDEIKQRCVRRSLVGTQPPVLTAEAKRLDKESVKVSGTVDVAASGALTSLEVTVDGVPVGPVSVDEKGTWSVVTKTLPFNDVEGDVSVRFVNEPDQSLAMIVVVASAKNGRSDGKLLFV